MTPEERFERIERNGEHSGDLMGLVFRLGTVVDKLVDGHEALSACHERLARSQARLEKALESLASMN